jgi:4-oxalomesaconate tautomerase
MEEQAVAQRIPCVLMRGGTSRGPVLLASDLPADPARRDAVLVRVMGSPDPLQLDGLGGGKSITSKVAIVSRSTQPGADMDYLFAQVKVHEARVDTKPNCGNMLSAVGPFAIEAGLVAARDPETVVRILNVNTRTLVEAIVQTPGGQVQYEGDTRIDGVPEPAAPVKLTFLDAMGAMTGSLLPTGRVVDVIGGVEASCVDLAMPVVIMAAEAFGKTGAEMPEELEADRALFARLAAIRVEAGRIMGLGDVSRAVVPKPVLVSRARNGGSIASRYFTPVTCHRSHAATGALAVATAAVMPGSVASRYVDLSSVDAGRVAVEHPAGRIEVELELSGSAAHPEVRRASLVRTVRRIFEGHVLVPEAVYSGARHPMLKEEP